MILGAAPAAPVNGEGYINFMAEFGDDRVTFSHRKRQHQTDLNPTA